MSNEKTIAAKKRLVEELSTKLNGAVAGVIIDYKGITVEEDTKLRTEMRKANVEYFVAKNTILKFAIKNTSLASLSDAFKGTTSVAISNTDQISAAKIIAKYSDELGDRFNIKAGFADGKVLSVEEVNTFAKLPSKEELIASALRELNAPISGFVNVLAANIRRLAIVLNAIAKKQAA